MRYKFYAKTLQVVLLFFRSWVIDGRKQRKNQFLRQKCSIFAVLALLFWAKSVTSSVTTFIR